MIYTDFDFDGWPLPLVCSGCHTEIDPMKPRAVDGLCSVCAVKIMTKTLDVVVPAVLKPLDVVEKP